MLSYDDDAHDRLMGLMTERDIAFRGKLERSSKMAGQQLEFLKPAYLAPGGYMGSVAQVSRGTILVVLADPRRVFTVYIQRPPVTEPNLIEILDIAVSELMEIVPESSDPGYTLHVIKNVLETHGGKPGKKKSKSPDQQVILQILGLLFASMPTESRHQLLYELIKVSNEVCPAMVGLIGPGTIDPTKMCGVWPLLLPLAPYVEAIDDRIGVTFH